MVRDFAPGAASGFPRYFVDVGVTFFFSARMGSDSANDELWKSDGTEEGTVLVKEIVPGESGSNPSDMVNVGGILYFRARDNDNDFGPQNYELWKSDGSEAGTVLVKEILSGSTGSSPNYLTNVSGTLYFKASNGTNGFELWKSDGTESGTVQVKDILVGSAGSTPKNLTNVGGILYFTASNSTNGTELWRSDGTEAGTVLVKDIFAGSSSSNPNSLTNWNGVLYFAATDGINGSELWKSDGSETGTIRIKENQAGWIASNPYYLTNLGGMLYFRATDVGNNTELWKSDGTDFGTVQVGDIWYGSNASRPQSLTVAKGMLFFSADDGAHGRELWRYDPNDAPILDAIGNQTIGEEPWSLVITATDADAADTLTFSLGPGAPAGMSITPGPGARQATISWTPGDNALISPNPQSITVIVTDNGDGSLSDSETIQLTVASTPPTPSWSGPLVTRTGISQTFTLLATDPAAPDQAAGFTFDIDWDANGTFDQTVVGPSGTQVTHAFSTAGSYNIAIRATDKDSAARTEAPFAMHVWSLSQSGGNVVWDGSGGDDVVEFTQLSATSVRVRTINIGGNATNVTEDFSGVTGRVIAKGGNGHDVLNAAALTTIPATLEGGRHNDTLTGGNANDILRGEFVGVAGDGAEGNDSIIGGAGNDLIQGDGLEGGKDTIRGGAGEDTIFGDGGDGLEGRADSIFGDDGIDVMFGNHGHDYIEAGSGEFNYLSGGDGAESNDTLVGGAGSDLMTGQNGNDSLIGGGEPDVLLGGDGADTLSGGDSEDILVGDITSFDAGLMTTAFEILDEWWGAPWEKAEATRSASPN